MYHDYLSYSYHNFSVLVELVFLSSEVISSFIIFPSRLSSLSYQPRLFLGQNMLTSNQSSTCFFFLSCILFWLPAASSDLVSHRQREELPWYSQKYHCLCLLERGKKRHRPPSTPSTIALPPLTLSPPPAASVGAGKAQLPRTTEGQTSGQSDFPVHWRWESSLCCIVALDEYKSSLYAFLLEGRRQATHGMLLFFPAKEKNCVITLGSRDGHKKGKWLLGCSTLTDNGELLEKSLFLLFLSFLVNGVRE